MNGITEIVVTAFTIAIGVSTLTCAKGVADLKTDVQTIDAEMNEVFYVIGRQNDIEKRIDDVEKQLAEEELESIQVFITEEEEEQEDYENELIEDALLSRANCIPNCTVTAYDICVKCCGNTNGITATGQKALPWITVAVDPKVIPLHSQVFIEKEDGEILYCVATDTGSGVKGNHVDLCTTDHQTSLKWGRKTLNVYWIAPEETK